MYSLKLQRFLNLMRLLDVMSAEPVIQLEYLRWNDHPEPEMAMAEFLEDLQGYESLLEEMTESGEVLPEERELFDRLLHLSEVIDSQSNSYTTSEILYGEKWREMRDTALLLRMSASSRSVLKLMR
ncbi:hypothetical protein [Streptomyces sp. 8N616]|uniref:hypothetical protein n=1 Tax=Streptomyces sp. 8N616 TaxID=3457414 RepID=UPI003FD0DEAE